MGRQRGTARETAVERWGYTSAVDMAKALPHHFKPIADTPTLIEEERDSLAQCEAAIETLKTAFWAAGKALQIVRDGRLYRGEFDSFEAYCEERWQIGRDYADRLIKAWPVAERLLADDQEAGRRLNESQVRVLLPVAARHGDEAAALVYRTVGEIMGGAVTADVLRTAVRALPQAKSKKLSADRAASAIRAALRKVSEKKPGTRRKARAVESGGGTAGQPGDIEPLLPWDSPEALNRVLRQYMSLEDRRTLGKMLMEE